MYMYYLCNFLVQRIKQSRHKVYHCLFRKAGGVAEKIQVVGFDLRFTVGSGKCVFGYEDSRTRGTDGIFGFLTSSKSGIFGIITNFLVCKIDLSGKDT